MEIRSLQSADIPGVMEWLPSCLPWRKPSELEQLLGSCEFLIAVEDDRVVSIGGYARERWGLNVWSIFLGATHPDYRGQGIYPDLIREQMDLIYTADPNARIFVSTKKPERFERLGFHRIAANQTGSVQLHYGRAV